MSENWKKATFQDRGGVCGSAGGVWEWSDLSGLGAVPHCHAATLPQCHSATVPRGEASAQLSRCSPATLVPTTATPYSTTLLWHMQKKDNTNCIYVLTRRTTKNWVIANFTKYWNMCRIQRKKIHCTVFVTDVAKAFENPPTRHQTVIVCSHQRVFFRVSWHQHHLPPSHTIHSSVELTHTQGRGLLPLYHSKQNDVAMLGNHKSEFLHVFRINCNTEHKCNNALQWCRQDREGMKSEKKPPDVCPTQPIVNSTNKTHSWGAYRTSIGCYTNTKRGKKHWWVVN